ncbi:AMP-binding protein [Nocardioides sp. NPDC127514]|uniref:AMP-dependent synthetase/ligase n=1 Tax=Nocardioides sp. NPDC127514 TaxID=3154243 RepID=UPI003324EF6E
MTEALLQTAEARGDQPALATADGDTALSWGEYADQAKRVATGLSTLGVGHGDTLAILLTNRPEFHVTDAAALMLGATPFSMYNTYPPEQLAHLLTDTACTTVVTEPVLLQGILAARELGAPIEQVIVVGGTGDDGILWEDLLDHPPLAHQSVAAPDDIATIIYTSGTTGPPKGVQLTHRNLLAMAGSVLQVMPVSPDNNNISYLPMAHVAERVCSHYMPMIVGFSIACCAVPADIATLLPKVRPNVFFSPPRLWEKLRSAILSNIEASPDELRAAATLALDVGLRAVRDRQAGREASDAAVAEHAATEPIRAAIRARVGLDQVVVGITGAAPCPPPVIEFFHALGISLQEIYGLSESTGLITMTRPDKPRLGTVGKVLPGMELRLADDGEVLARGPLIMAGYRNRPDSTAEAIDADGWLHTGDIGILDDDGSLRIVDRKKELIINSAGKNMSPANIEAKLKEASPLIGQAICVGDARPYNVALLVLDPEAAVAFAGRNGIAAATVADLARHPEIQAAVGEGVDRANAMLARVEQIKRFTILEVDWQPGTDELTPTMKLKRRPIAEKYASDIDALYADVPEQ